MVKSNGRVIAGICIYLFIIFACIALGTTLINDFLGEPLLFILAAIPFIFAGVFGLLLYKFIKSAYSERQIGKEKGKFKFGFKQAVFAVIFFLAFMPFVLPLFDHGLNLKDHSIYNPTWSGCSDFAKHLQTQGYDVRGIQSTLSTTMRNNDTYKVIVMLGPNRWYNPVQDIAFYIDFINAGGSLFICDDKGSTNTLLMQMSVLTGMQTPFVEFPKGLLADNASYIPGKDPYFPVITSFDSAHPTARGVKSVALNHASAMLPFGAIISLLMGGGSSSGFAPGASMDISIIGTTTPFYSYVDVNQDYYFDPKVDEWDPNMVTDFLMGVMPLNETEKQSLKEYASALLLGALPKVVFGCKDLPKGRIFISGDASFLSNQLYNDPTFDNARFGDNIIEWLANPVGQNNLPSNVTVYFDEAHIRPEGVQEFASAYIYGMFIGYVNWLSSSAILAWIYPFLALYTLTRWLPPDQEKLAKKAAKKKEKKQERDELETDELRVKYKTETAFVKKIKALREGSDFNEPLMMLYRRILRRLNRLLGDQEATSERIINIIKTTNRKDLTANDETRLQTFFDTMDEIRSKTSRRKISTEDEFKDLFYEMTWVADWLNINVM